VSDVAEAHPSESPGRPQGTKIPSLMRKRSGEQRVTNIELFFDLVYVFAITQLSHFLLAHATVRGALQAGLLLAMVWTVWAYTTWVTNWVDPEQMAVRLLLVALMLASMTMSISLAPDATASAASRAFTSDKCLPDGKPATAATRTPAAVALGTIDGETQTA